MTADEIEDKARMAREMFEFFFWKKHMKALNTIVKETNEDTAGEDTRFGLEVSLSVVTNGQARLIPIAALLPAFNGPETGEVTTGIQLFALPSDEGKPIGPTTSKAEKP